MIDFILYFAALSILMYKIKKSVTNSSWILLRNLILKKNKGLPPTWFRGIIFQPTTWQVNNVRYRVGQLFFFGGCLYSQTFLGLRTEEQGVATWFIGPRTINMTSYTKGLVFELGPELRYVLGRC